MSKDPKERPAPPPFSKSVKPVTPFEIKFEGTLQDLQNEIVKASDLAAQKKAGLSPATAGLRSQILEAAYTNVVLANANKLVKINFGLRFSLTFSLRW